MKVFHAIFSYNLSPNSMKLYIYLTACKNCLGTAAVRSSTLASACSINSRSTVFAALAELEDKGLVSKFTRRNRDGDYIANGYHVKQLEGKWFVLPSLQIALLLPKASFSAYLCLLKHSNIKGRAWPSIRKMSEFLCASCNTVLAAIKDLVGRGLVRKGDKRKGKHNLYYVQRTKLLEEQIKKSHTVGTPCDSTQTENCTSNFRTIILAATKDFVKYVKTKASFFMNRVLQKSYTSILNYLKL